MNNFVRTFRSVLGVSVVLCSVFCLFGCIQQEDLETLSGDYNVTLRVDETFQEKAYVRLNHDGDQNALWYHVWTDDLDVDAKTELEARIAKTLQEEGRIIGGAGVNRNITIEGLQPNTTYRVIAAVLTPAGEIVSNVADLKFKTQRNPDVFEVHPDWKIEYVQRLVDKNDSDNETELIKCTVVDTTETYVPCLLAVEEFENTYKKNYRSCFEGYVQMRNDEHVKWPKVVRRGNVDHIEDRLTHGDYYLFMIGIDSLGTLTGNYAQTLCKIEQEEATDAYKKWIGNNWTLSGMCGEQEISYPVRIVPEENNLYLRMYGWESTTAGEGMTNVPEDLPILLYFEKSSGDVYVISEQLDDLDNPALADLHDFFLYGCIKMDYQGTLTDVPVDTPYLQIARFTMSGSNRATATGMRISLEAYGIPEEMEFIYFNYSYTLTGIYNGLIPVTMDAAVPRINTLVLSK